MDLASRHVKIPYSNRTRIIGSCITKSKVRMSVWAPLFRRVKVFDKVRVLAKSRAWEASLYLALGPGVVDVGAVEVTQQPYLRTPAYAGNGPK